MTEQTPVDRDSLFERVDNDLELLEELLEIFEEDSQQHIDAMRAALNSSDADQFARSAHSLKGSSYNMSAVRLADISLELEKAGYEGSLDGLEDKVNELEAELRRVIPALKEILGQS